MSRRLFLHIGTPKSATSYLQDLFALNSDKLAAQGVRWVDGDRYAALRDLLARRNTAADDGAWKKWIGPAREYDGDLLISCETLVTLDEMQIQRFVEALPPGELCIIITARDLVRTIPSQWQTMLKNGRTTDWSTYSNAICQDGDTEFLSTGTRAPDERTNARRLRDQFWLKHDLPAIISRWRSVAPIEKFTLVTLPIDNADQGAVSIRFGDILGWDSSRFLEPKGAGNSSMGAWSAELLRRINGQLTDIDRNTRKVGIRDALAKEVLSALAVEEPRYALAQEQLDWASRRSERMVQELRLLQIRVRGDLEDLLPESSAVSRIDPAAASDTELLDVAMKGLIGMATSLAAMAGDQDDTLERESPGDAR